jgi:hypothetical protein
MLRMLRDHEKPGAIGRAIGLRRGQTLSPTQTTRLIQSTRRKLEEHMAQLGILDAVRDAFTQTCSEVVECFAVAKAPRFEQEHDECRTQDYAARGVEHQTYGAKQTAVSLDRQISGVFAQTAAAFVAVTNAITGAAVAVIRRRLRVVGGTD